MSHRPFEATVIRSTAVLAVALLLALAGCTRPAPVPVPVPPEPAPSGNTPEQAPGPYSKVLLIMEENHEYDAIIGDQEAPYLNDIAARYGIARHLDAGYPPQCPSLAAYLLLTSGSTHGVCDDRAPRAHPLTSDNLFHQVAASGREWRNYAESAPGPCPLDNADQGRYLVRHVPATYYVNERADCARWVLPLGDLNAGALHTDVAAGTLPAFGLISPDACHDMHGADACPQQRTATGDQWLRDWLTQILAGPDYRAGRLVVIITWDEGSKESNHIPTLVIAPTTQHVTADGPYTHCSTLHTMADILRVPPLGCAATAPAMTDAFHLAAADRAAAVRPSAVPE
ncbi:alkaline phosphatase family protein [Krasilnikovia sp. MM14-A1259]|uniref:alkaline phosphatase family protein n=1 Tax=Krasilnikovia sp. MM14-A1259 TaxID=3373539 RepID=UPI0037F728C7